MQPQNVFLQTFIHDLITNGVCACNSFLSIDIWHVTCCMIEYYYSRAARVRMKPHKAPNIQ